MGSLAKKYIKKMKQQFQRSPIWLPTEKYEVGDYGFYQKGDFIKKGNIFNDFSIDHPTPTTDNNQPKFSYLIKSDRATSVMSTGEGTAGEINVSYQVDFQRKSGFIIQMFSTISEQMPLSQDLANALKTAQDNGKWDKDYRIIRARVLADYIKFAYSLSSNGSIQLSGKADTPEFNIASISLNIKNSTDINSELWQISGQASPLVSLAAFSDEGHFEPKLNKIIIGREKEIFAETSVLYPTDEDSFPTPVFGIDVDNDEE